MFTLPSLDSSTELLIGTTNTPSAWAKFAIEEFGILGRWLDGATICDPTMGEGDLLISLVRSALATGFEMPQLPLDRLFGTELNRDIFLRCLAKLTREGITIPKKNLVNEDWLFREQDERYDFIFGNPPWVNYVDLSHDYQAKVRTEFRRFDLIGNPGELLLGNSRADLSALIIQKSIHSNLNDHGKLVMFVPLSLLLNDGANKHFRRYQVRGTKFHINKIIDFNALEIFKGVSTRYGIISLERDSVQAFPIEYQRWEGGNWRSLYAQPCAEETSPLSVGPISRKATLRPEPILLTRHAIPRQGINTCGANKIFFFDQMLDENETECLVANDTNRVWAPRSLVLPLVTAGNFAEETPVPKKWALVPHARSGRPLPFEEIAKSESLISYLHLHQSFLERRKGAYIGGMIKRGYWWSLLGVGEYSFFPYKLIWQAYGASEFNPKIFAGYWQANQSLQAFMPMIDAEEATATLKKLQDGRVSERLASSMMEGTMNWAQPGRIKRLIENVL